MMLLKNPIDDPSNGMIQRLDIKLLTSLHLLLVQQLSGHTKRDDRTVLPCRCEGIVRKTRSEDTCVPCGVLTSVVPPETTSSRRIETRYGLKND